MIIIIISFILVFILLFLYCAIKVSSDCSREEELIEENKVINTD